MSESTAKINAESTSSSPRETEIMFKCKICGQSKPLKELVLVKNYFPQLSACKVCAHGLIDHEGHE